MMHLQKNNEKAAGKLFLQLKIQ